MSDTSPATDLAALASAAGGLSDRVILITGAASGIGAATARALAAPGVSLMLHTRSQRDALAAVAQVCRDRGAQADLVCSDLNDAGAGTNLIGRVLARFERI
ncbi:MAG: SDR family NAD(P)-dependent oxidoreductase, partial [Cyanobacteria bacterium M_surface_9_m1_291]|nr:SDR family NAD(P)-dependent oxidoreductase [Cyanobacteria bacterium M_surface_9_m1_291]